MTLEEKILLGYFFCTSVSTPFIEELKPEWLPFIELSLSEKCKHFGISIKRLFPNLDDVDDSIDKSQFAFSHLLQPDLFLRIRPDHEQNVKNKLDQAQLNYTLLDQHCLALNNTTKVEDLLQVNKEVVIQDYASQRVGKMLDLVKTQFQSSKNKLKVWDCCAASGGKTILAVDKLGAIDITLSDVRDGILNNLKKRLKEAHISSYKSKKIDLSKAKNIDPLESFDLIIADVPCSGSGTWSRTPERLLYFDEKEIKYYSKLQKTITQNIQSKLKPGAFLLYITCSVYKQENNEIVENLIHHFGLDLIQSEIYAGYEFKSDTMYAALLRKSA